MAKLSKRVETGREQIEKKLYPVQEAFALMKKMALKTFDESVDAIIMLGVDPRKSDQVVRGATLLPEGSGRAIKVVVFAQGKNAELAEQAGADIVGFEELAEEIKKGRADFDLVIATPDTMRVVGQLGQILGPKGMMPNPKVGTVTTNVEQAIQNAKSGQARYRADKAGIIHCSIGKASFSPESLQRNLTAVITDLKKLKPATAKGIYFKKVFVSSTMGPGLQVDISSITD